MVSLPTPADSSEPRSRQPLSVSALRRLVAEVVPGAELARDDSVALETLELPHEPTHLIACNLLEGPKLGRLSVGEGASRFRAFLDGKQKSFPIAFVRGVALIHGSVAAVVRTRVDDRAVTWRMLRDNLLCAPLAHLADALPASLLRAVRVEDTDEELGGDAPESTTHPVQRSRRAYHAIQNAREQLEQTLVRDWCAAFPDEQLLIDGPVSRRSLGGNSRAITGLVKTHRTMYLRDAEVEEVLALAEGERSSAFLIESGNEAVASWYLRLRRENGSDPLWGLVRVEVPRVTFSSEEADARSRWILAERSPISLPDARWDRLLYGIRDCEMFLTAVM